MVTTTSLSRGRGKLREMRGTREVRGEECLRPIMREQCTGGGWQCKSAQAEFSGVISVGKGHKRS